jgi:Tfp pilus assembly protein PilX
MIYEYSNKKIKTNKGYTMLFAVLVSSVVLSVGISILNINKKEYLLASSARESIVAFYAADSALECAAYHDLNQNRFSFSDYTTNVSCMGRAPFTPDATTIGAPFSSNSGTTVARFDLNLNSISCATVIVTKSPTGTSIESRGYNIGWNKDTSKCNLASPKRVERVLYYTY